MYRRASLVNGRLPSPHTPGRRIVGLTGGVGSGKSTVAQMFAARGATIIDADLLAREVVRAGTPGLAAVISRFGPEYLDGITGELKRRELAQLVFSDPSARADLEDILHPLIRARFTEALAHAMRASPPASAGEPLTLIVYVVPLLFESRFTYPELDTVVVVSAPPDVMRSRMMARDGCSEAHAQQRLAAQLPIEEKEARADLVIRNSSSLHELEQQVEEAFRTLSH